MRHHLTLIDFPQKEANRSYMVIAAAIAATEIGDVTGKTRYSFEITFEVQPDTIRFRPERTIPKPRTHGPQMAVVTGAAGNTVWTDRFGRVKIKFNWDRLGSNDQNSSCWVRVMYPWSGSAFGSISIPRVGTEVIVDFVNGDPDRPIVVGQMYNAMQMPPWQLPGNLALAGYRSQMLDGSQANSLVFDDTQGKIQAQLASDEGQSQLSLGYITRIAGNAGRKDERGRGFDLRTDLWGVVRALKGLFVTTDGQPGGPGHVKEAKEAITRLEKAQELQASLAGLAQQHEAQVQGAGSQGDTPSPGSANQNDVAKAIQSRNTVLRGTAAGAAASAATGAEAFPELAERDIVISGPAGVSVSADRGVHISGGEDVAVTARRHLGLAVSQSLFASVSNAISLFVH